MSSHRANRIQANSYIQTHNVRISSILQQQSKTDRPIRAISSISQQSVAPHCTTKHRVLSERTKTIDLYLQHL